MCGALLEARLPRQGSLSCKHCVGDYEAPFHVASCKQYRLFLPCGNMYHTQYRPLIPCVKKIAREFQSNDKAPKLCKIRKLSQVVNYLLEFPMQSEYTLMKKTLFAFTRKIFSGCVLTGDTRKYPRTEMKMGNLCGIHRKYKFEPGITFKFWKM